MDDFARWSTQNEDYLAAALAWLRLRLAYLIARQEGGDVAALEGELAQASRLMAEARAVEPPPALVMLGQQLELSRFEQDILLLCAATEFDTGMSALYARAQNSPNQPYPTFALALTLFDSPTWDALSPRRPLRYWRLLDIVQVGVQPLTTSPLRADERIVNYLKGLNYLDEQLIPLLAPLSISNPNAALPPSQQAIVQKIIEQLQGAAAFSEMPFVQLLGADPQSKQLIAWHTATQLGLHLYRLPVELLPRQAAELEALVRLWQRESRLLPVALYLDAQELDEVAPDDEGPLSSLTRFVGRAEGIIFIAARDVRDQVGRPTLDLDIAKPTPTEQQSTWAALLEGMAPDSPSRLAGQFNLGLATIEEIVASVREAEPPDERTAHNLLWDGCLIRTRPQLDTLAQRLTPKATWSDIVLSQDGLVLLRQISDQVRKRGVVYDEWGFRQKMNRGLGIMALFAGKSGTGKTMAAEVIANDLRLNLYRIDLSAVVSKYIGETEKNLRRLFDAAEDGGAILFFDEADALFGSRSQVRDSHDRYANIEINYLLQRMEAYQGLAILATNMKSGLDDAFTRRLRFIINFPVPEKGDRKRIWQKIFPPETPLATLDFDRLAGFDLAGGSIYNVALNAAFQAARLGTQVTMPLMLNAIRMELLKSDRLIEEKDFY